MSEHLFTDETDEHPYTADPELDRPRWRKGKTMTDERSARFGLHEPRRLAPWEIRVQQLTATDWWRALPEHGRSAIAGLLEQVDALEFTLSNHSGADWPSNAELAAQWIAEHVKVRRRPPVVPDYNEEAEDHHDDANLF